MKLSDLSRKNAIYFARYYRLTFVAALVTVAVITGSLMVGDSVRATLVRKVTERLGDTRTVVFSRNSFMEQSFAGSPVFGATAKGIMMANGFISHNGELIPVSVWGVDDSVIHAGAAKSNLALNLKMGLVDGASLSLRLPSPGLTPSGSLFVTDNYTSSLRLSYAGTIEKNGNINLRNEQTTPLNIFVNRAELNDAMNTAGKINLIMSDKIITDDEIDSAWNYAVSGLTVRQRADGAKGEFSEIASDRIFLQDKVVENIAAHNNVNRVFSYLANSIAANGATIPYSFVTALDSYGGQPLQYDEVILSDYSAQRLNASVGDSVKIAYYTSEDLKTLRVDSITLHVKSIVPLSELTADSTLSADFPGLSDVDKCTDWDSDLPINMSLITDEDERYWEQYRAAPKAIISYRRIAASWSNAYGCATAVRTSAAAPDLSALRANMFGIQVIHPREAGLQAAANGVDFSGLFLALGFFIIIAAALLLLVPLSEMLYRRRGEIELMQALGYAKRRIARILWLETAPVVAAASLAGIAAGWLYTSVVMWLLGNVWSGATHAENLSVYPSVGSILTGALAGVVISLCLLRWSISRNLRDKRAYSQFGIMSRYAGRRSLNKLKTQVAVAAALVLSIIVVNGAYARSVALFVVTGALGVGLFAVYGNYLIRKKTSGNAKFDASRMMWATLMADRKQAALSFFALSTGMFIVLSVGLNRQDFADSSRIKTGTGGYSLWCESSVPIYHNLSTREGREKLSLADLPDNTGIVQCLRYSADDASCLNLNKTTTPTALGIDMKALSEITIDALPSPDGRSIWEQMQARADSVYPALVDATVLEWSLGKRLGDTLWYKGDGGRDIAIRLTGVLPNTIFQGNILIDRALFSEIWPETTGSEVFLVKTDTPDTKRIQTLLSQALSEYGVRVSTTNDRLREFNSVTDAYLTIFMTLGGIGLLLGVVSFVVIVRKNLVSRRREIELYETLGFTSSKVEWLLRRESLLVPLYSIVAGVAGALIGVSGGLANIGGLTWLIALFFVAATAGCMIVFVNVGLSQKL